MVGMDLGDQRLSRAERLTRVERLLFDSPAGMRALDVAHETGVNRRTIYRDVETLRERGVPIWQEGGRFGIARDRYRPCVRLNFDAVMALLVGAQMLAGHAHDHYPAVAAALTDLATAVPYSLAALLRQHAEAIAGHAVNDDHVAALEVVAQGWANLRTVRLWYQGATHDVSTYFVMPAGVGGVYLVGLDGTSGEMRTFRLGWVERARLLEETYTLPADFDLAQYFRRPWPLAGDAPRVEVVLRFSPGVASSVMGRLWHPTQVLEERADGGCRLTMQVVDVNEIRAWVLAWGAVVEVLAPPVLRANVAAEARRLGAMYG